MMRSLIEYMFPEVRTIDGKLMYDLCPSNKPKVRECHACHEKGEPRLSILGNENKSRENESLLDVPITI